MSFLIFTREAIEDMDCYAFGEKYTSVDDFFETYFRSTLEPIPSGLLNDDQVFQILNDPSRERTREYRYEIAQEISQGNGAHVPTYFEDEQIIFLIVDGSLIYNAYKSAHILTNQLLYEFLLNKCIIDGEVRCIRYKQPFYTFRDWLEKREADPMKLRLKNLHSKRYNKRM